VKAKEIKAPKPKQYTCQLVFYQKVDEDDNGKHRSTIMHNGQKYRQIWAYKMADVTGNIQPYNNKRTWRPNKDNMDNVEYNAAKIHWDQLVTIIKTDKEITFLRMIN